MMKGLENNFNLINTQASVMYTSLVEFVIQESPGEVLADVDT